MLNPLLFREYSNMPIELKDLLLRRNDWYSFLNVKVGSQSPSPLLNDSGNYFSNADHVLRTPSVSRSTSNSESGSSNDADILQSTDSLRGAAKAGKSERYKTELCRSYEETGFCKYKEKCQFAHGVQELRNVHRHPKYKTDRCRTYHSTGFCPYGSRCHFIHAEQTTPEAQPQLQPQQFNDFRNKINDQEVGLSLDQVEQILKTFNRVIQVVSSRSPPSQSPSPTFLNFDGTGRNDSVSSGSRRSSPDRLSIPSTTAIVHDDVINMMPPTSYSRFLSCSSDDAFAYAVQSPTSPSSLFSSTTTPDSSPCISHFWTRTMQHPLSNFFEA